LGLFSKNQFCGGKGLVYIRFQAALDIVFVSLLVAGVVGQPVGFFLGVAFGFVSDAGVTGCSVGEKRGWQ
jgi:ABC-type dipeptide/oligopeptide/nickel transport system permease component